jgi:hypothetical protein
VRCRGAASCASFPRARARAESGGRRRRCCRPPGDRGRRRYSLDIEGAEPIAPIANGVQPAPTLGRGVSALRLNKNRRRAMGNGRAAIEAMPPRRRPGAAERHDNRYPEKMR